MTVRFRTLWAGLLALGLMGVAAMPARAAIIESFEDGNLVEYTAVGSNFTTSVAAQFAHDGNFGLGFDGDLGAGWIYRDDAGVQLSQGDTFSVWIQFDGIADARAYFGFGSSAGGTLSFVLAANTGELLLQDNTAYNFAILNSTGQTYQADKWYLAEVVWALGGNITGNLYDSDGLTLLNSVAANTNAITSGGIAFRGFDGVKAFDTVSTRESQEVPEPSTLVLCCIGMAIGGARAARRRASAN